MTIGFETDNSSDPQGVGGGTHQRDERPEDPPSDLTQREADVFVQMALVLHARGAYEVRAGGLVAKFERKDCK